MFVLANTKVRRRFYNNNTQYGCVCVIIDIFIVNYSTIFAEYWMWFDEILCKMYKQIGYNFDFFTFLLFWNKKVLVSRNKKWISSNHLENMSLGLQTV